MFNNYEISKKENFNIINLKKIEISIFFDMILYDVFIINSACSFIMILVFKFTQKRYLLISLNGFKYFL